MKQKRLSQRELQLLVEACRIRQLDIKQHQDNIAAARRRGLATHEHYEQADKLLKEYIELEKLLGNAWEAVLMMRENSPEITATGN